MSYRLKKEDPIIVVYQGAAVVKYKAKKILNFFIRNVFNLQQF